MSADGPKASLVPTFYPFQERQPTSDERPPVNDGLPPHKFVPSEFAPESGRCDQCGGGAGAPIHSKPVDQMARIADALERIADSLERVEGDGPSLSYSEVQELLEKTRTRTKADGE